MFAADDAELDLAADFSPTARRRGSIARLVYEQRIATDVSAAQNSREARRLPAGRGHRRARPHAGRARARRSSRRSSRLAAEGPTRGRDRARPRAGRSAVHVPSADRRRVRRQVRSAERLQRVPRRSRASSTATSRATSDVTRGLASRRRQPVPCDVPPRRARASCRAGETDLALAGFGPGAGLMTRAHDRRPQPAAGAGATPPVPLSRRSKSPRWPNGLRVWTVRTRHPGRHADAADSPRRGRRPAPARRGSPRSRVDMLDEGSGTRSAIEMHEALARDRRAARFRHRLRRRAAHGHRAQPVRRAARWRCSPTSSRGRRCTEADFERVRQLRLHRLTQLRDMPGAVADRAFVRLLYGDHPYGHTPLGSERSLASTDRRRRARSSISRRCCVRPRRRWSSPATASTTTIDAARRRRRSAAGAGRRPAPLPVDDRRCRSPARLNVIPRPGAPQSELRIGHVAVPRNTPDYHALVAANMVLGGQFVSRINLNLREEKGFTYGARTVVRLPPPARSVRAAGQRADRGDGRGDRRIARRRSQRFAVRARSRPMSSRSASRR